MATMTSSSAWSPSESEVTLPNNNDAQLTDSLERALNDHDDIRFASYRTAAKLRTLQKMTYLYHIDIWNMIEAFREGGLNGMDPSAKLTEAKVQSLINALYDGLQKRLPPSTETADSSKALKAKFRSSKESKSC